MKKILIFAVAVMVLLMACGDFNPQETVWSEYEVARQEPIVTSGFYNSPIHVTVANVPAPGDWTIDYARVEVANLYSGGGFNMPFGIGPDCGNVISFDLYLAAGENITLMRPANNVELDWLESYAGDFRICPVVNGAVDMDLRVTTRGQARQ